MKERARKICWKTKSLLYVGGTSEYISKNVLSTLLCTLHLLTVSLIDVRYPIPCCVIYKESSPIFTLLSFPPTFMRAFPPPTCLTKCPP